MTGVKEASIDVAGLTLKIAVVYGTENADKFLQGDVSQYHFVEVMSLPRRLHQRCGTAPVSFNSGD